LQLLYKNSFCTFCKQESEKPKERKRSATQVLGAILEGPLEDFYQDTFNFDLAR